MTKSSVLDVMHLTRGHATNAREKNYMCVKYREIATMKKIQKILMNNPKNLAIKIKML